METKITPVKNTERILLIDSLRGLAIFGILMVNMPLMYEPITQILSGAKSDISGLELAADAFIKFFFEGKFYVLFSMLFGYGFYIFLRKSTEQQSIIPTYRRRLFILLLFGTGHVLLLWPGDILIFYALFGFVLILFRKSSDRKIIKWSIALALLPSLLSLLGVVLVGIFISVPEAKTSIESGNAESMESIQALIQKAYLIYSTGSFPEMVHLRMEEYAMLLPGLLFFYPVVLAMFLLGYYAARRQLLASCADHKELFRRIFKLSLPTGLISSLLYVISYYKTDHSMPDIWSFLNSLCHTLSGIALSLSYVSGLVLLVIGGKLQFLLNWLAPAGRMALTNYIMHSLITAFIFHSYGLALYGKIEVWQGIILTMGIFLIQIPFSKWWLARFRFGPLEWLWRSLTYGKIQAFRKV